MRRRNTATAKDPRTILSTALESCYSWCGPTTRFLGLSAASPGPARILTIRSQSRADHLQSTNIRGRGKRLGAVGIFLFGQR